MQSNDDHYAFVTANTKDFFDGDSEDVDLIIDFNTRGLDHKRIELFTSLQSFNDKIIIPHLELIDTATSIVSEGIQAWADTELANFIDEYDLSADIFGFYEARSVASITKVLKIEGINILSGRRLRDNTHVHASIHFTAAYAIDCSHQDYARDRGVREYIDTFEEPLSHNDTLSTTEEVYTDLELDIICNSDTDVVAISVRKISSDMGELDLNGPEMPIATRTWGKKP